MTFISIKKASSALFILRVKENNSINSNVALKFNFESKSFFSIFFTFIEHKKSLSIKKCLKTIQYIKNLWIFEKREEKSDTKLLKKLNS